MKIEIDSWEDRSGGPAGPTSFGYVYFTDGSRVGFSPATEDHDDIWQPRTNGGGKYQAVTTEHVRLARELLHEEGVL